jgi:two-component system, response regulator
MTAHLPVEGILIAEDDADDRYMITRALKEAGLNDSVETVDDGVDLLDYLRGKGKFAETTRIRPRVVLLDLNMPRMSGREALVEMKQDPSLRLIPVVILTTSSSPVDVAESYAAGANAYVRKPEKYGDLASVADMVVRFWCRTVEVAPDGE